VKLGDLICIDGAACPIWTWTYPLLPKACPRQPRRPDADEKSAADALYRSLDPPPERLLMITYCAGHAWEGDFDLPA
jgi:hypothetical protein